MINSSETGPYQTALSMALISSSIMGFLMYKWLNVRHTRSVLCGTYTYCELHSPFMIYGQLDALNRKLGDICQINLHSVQILWKVTSSTFTVYL